jgi:hypothetical protein
LIRALDLRFSFLIMNLGFRRRTATVLLIALALSVAMAGAPVPPVPQKGQLEKRAHDKETPERQTAEKKDASVSTQMRNVKFRFADNISVQIKSLAGALVPVGEHEIPVIDDKNSFKIHVDAADILIYPSDLANVLNSYVFARPKSPVGGVSIAIDKGQLKIKGRLRDKGNIPFETIGTLSTTPDGRVRLHGEKIKALHVPVKGLMEAFGIEIDDLIKNGKIPGVFTEENDLILDLQQVLPAPHIEGSVTDIRIKENAIATTFGKSTAKATTNAPASGNFMAYQGNRMAFGKLTMDNVDMILLDLNPADPLDFFLEHYREQLAAGYTKISASFQFRAYMKDYGKLNREASPKPQSN